MCCLHYSFFFEKVLGQRTREEARLEPCLTALVAGVVRLLCTVGMSDGTGVLYQGSVHFFINVSFVVVVLSVGVHKTSVDP